MVKKIINKAYNLPFSCPGVISVALPQHSGRSVVYTAISVALVRPPPLGIRCLALEPPEQERHGIVGEDPEDSKDDWRIVAPLL